MTQSVKNWKVFWRHLERYMKDRKENIKWDKILKKDLSDRQKFGSVKNSFRDGLVSESYIKKKRINVDRHLFTNHFYDMLEEFVTDKTLREEIEIIAEEETGALVENIRKDIRTIESVKGISFSDAEEEQMLELAKNREHFEIIDENMEFLKGVRKANLEKVIEKKVATDVMKFTGGVVMDKTGDPQFRLYTFGKIDDPKTGKKVTRMITHFSPEAFDPADFE